MGWGWGGEGRSTWAPPPRDKPLTCRPDNDDDDEIDDDDDCIGNTLGKLMRIVKRKCEIFIETLNKNSLNFSTLENFVKFYITPYLSEF